jgi:two-component system sensor histidine kinase YcbA
MIILIPLVGELKFYPFQSTFRISPAILVFFFYLLSEKKINPILSGTIIGTSVIIFRIILDITTKPGTGLTYAFFVNLPSFFYYLIYSVLFYLIGSKYLNRHLLIALILIFIEITSCSIEIIFRKLLFNNQINITIFGEVILIAIIRSFFILGFFNIIKLYNTEMKMKLQKQENEQMTLLISNLYEESFQLKKSFYNAERITKKCYDIYSFLKTTSDSLDVESLSKKILTVAGEVHEIKKDNQRIYAGISKMISKGNSTDYMDMHEICSIIINTNGKYAGSLNKNIKFISYIEEFKTKFHAFTILSIINNLTANAVEAIDNDGYVKISIRNFGDNIEFSVSNNGACISEKKKDLIFKPGYTTKYDINGKCSTGIGLYYIKEIVTELKGTIKVISNNYETDFTIMLPIDILSKKE